MDEVQHSYFQTQVARTIISESNFSDDEMDEITDWIYDFFTDIVKSEKALADDLMKEFKLIDIDELHGYIEWRANLLLQNLGLDKIFKTKTNPMQWIKAFDSDNINNTKTDFFEKRVTNYSRPTNDKNDWDLL